MKNQILSIIIFLFASAVVAQDGSRSYCAANGGGNYEHIANVSIGSINNTSGYTTYSDFTSLSADLPGIGPINITVIIGMPWDEGDIVGAWIDWNQDDIFNESMITFTGSPFTNYTGSITVPPGATAGATRLRVRMQYNGELLPCGTTFYGEVEDYTVVVPEYIPPEISANPMIINTAITYYGGSGQESVRLTNTGEGDLYWNAEIDCGITSFGTEDYCLDFNGVDQYVLLNQPFPSFSQYTVEFWRYSEGSSSTGWPRMITMLQNDFHSPDYIVIEHDASDQNIFEITVDADANHYKAYVDVSAYHNQWLHVALTFDGTTTTTYLNGEVAHQSASGSASFQINKIQIGGCTMPFIGLYRYFNGRLDEIRFWNVARTQQQIQDCMDSTFCTPHEGLMAYWQLDDATGTVINDETGNMAPGSIMNGAAWFTPGSPLGNFCPPPPPSPVVEVTPTSGIVPPGGFVDLVLTFNSGDIPPGLYNNCNLFINSNDSDEGNLIVPLNVTVSGQVFVPIADWAVVLGVVLMVGMVVWFWRRG